MKVIVVGAGEVGFHIAGHLAEENKDVVVIDTDEEALRRVSDNIDAQTLEGSGSSPSVLEEAGIEEAEFMLALTSSDETNVVACVIADIISPNTKKLARLRGADFDKYHDIFRTQSPHIDTIINPEIEVVKTIESMMIVPGAVDVGEFADGRVKFVGIYLDQNSPLAGLLLSELPQKIKTDVPLIAAIIRNEKLIIPKGEDRLLAGDLIYFIAEENKLSEALSVFGKHSREIKHVLIIGGGSIGFRLASLLEEKSIYTKIIERNPERCKKLADELNKTIVLHGDGSDRELLSEENIQDMDAVITLTADEETNILTSLLVRRMGAGKTITRISKFSYFPIMIAIGIEQVVSPRLSAVNTILRHIRRGKVLSAVSLKGAQAEVFEAVAMETSEITDKMIKDIHLPKQVLIVGIIRNDSIVIPFGNTIIKQEDRIIIFAGREDIPKLEKILAVKMEYF